MVERDDLRGRCWKCVRDLNLRNGWGLDSDHIDGYVEAIVRHVPPRALETHIEVVVANYHVDHAQVAALIDAHHPQHAEAWLWLRGEIAAAAHSQGLSWSRDRATDQSDLVQIALVEVIRALPSYRYGSRLSTWIYGVVIRRLRRHHRDSGAHKRGGQLVEIEAADERPQEWSQTEQPIMASALAAEIRRVLDASGDTRYADIVLLRVLYNLSNEEIGKRLHLHESRVRALLKIARELLRADPGIRGWAGMEPDDGESK